jgi:hypothetical protein
MKNYIITGVVSLLVGFAIGYAMFHQTQTLVGAGSPTGATNGDKQYSSMIVVISSSVSSSTSILNNGSDRMIQDSFTSCQGLSTASTSVANLLSQIATTSVPNLGLQGNTNYVANMVVPTSSQVSTYVSSTTEGGIQYVSRLWPAGTYLTNNFNATDTGACTWGSDWFSL